MDMDECVLSKLKNHKQLLISKWRSRLIAAEEQYLYTLSQSDVGGRRQVQTNDKVNRGLNSCKDTSFPFFTFVNGFDVSQLSSPQIFERPQDKYQILSSSWLLGW